MYTLVVACPNGITSERQHATRQDLITELQTLGAAWDDAGLFLVGDNGERLDVGIWQDNQRLEIGGPWSCLGWLLWWL